MSEEEKQFDIFFPKTIEIHALNGEVLKISSQRSWKTDIEILRSIPVQQIMDSLSRLPDNPEERLQALGQFIQDLLGQLPDVIIEIVTRITGKDRGWCENNLDLEHVIDICIPFFAKCWRIWQQRLQILAQAQPARSGA